MILHPVNHVDPDLKIFRCICYEIFPKTGFTFLLHLVYVFGMRSSGGLQRYCLIFGLLIFLITSGMHTRLEAQSGTEAPVGFQPWTELINYGETSDYSLSVWTSGEGLPRSKVNAITQTKDGFLWIAFDDRIARFDGRTFKQFSFPRDRLGGNDKFQTLQVDSQDRLWVISMYNGVSLFDHKNFKPLEKQSEVSPGIYSLKEFSDGTLWIASEKGLQTLNPTTQKIEPPLSPVATIQPPGTSYKIWEDTAHSRIYACYWEHFGYWENNEFQMVQDENQVWIMSNNFFPRNQGGIWILSSETENYADLRHMDPGKAPSSPVSWPFEVPVYGISAFLQDREGNLWFAVRGDAVYRLSQHGVYERFDHANGDISVLFEDHFGAIWMGSETEGLSRAQKKPFTLFAADSPGVVGTVDQGADGRIYFTKGDSLLVIDEGKVELLDAKAPLGAIEDQSGNLWMGNFGGLLKSRHDENQFEKEAFWSEETFSMVSSMFESQNGNLYFGTWLGDVGVYDGAEMHLFHTQRHQMFSCFADGPGGSVWAGSIQGDVWKLQSDGLQRILDVDPLEDDTIACLYWDDDQVLWIGTEGGGVKLWVDEQLFSLNEFSGFPVQEVCAITSFGEDLWLTARSGVFRFNRNQLLQSRMQPNAPLLYSKFGASDGLKSVECVNQRFPNLCRSDDGIIWFAMVNEVVRLDPGKVTTHLTNPQCFIETVWADDKRLQIVNHSVEIPPGTRRIRIGYSAATINFPERSVFHYKLSGSDPDWINIGGASELEFNHLKPGRYDFNLRAYYGSEISESQPATLNLSVIPYFWETSIFKVSMSVLVFGLALFIFWIFHRSSYLRQLEKLERARLVEKERVRIASDLHDQLGAQTTQLIVLSSRLKSSQGADSDSQMETPAHLIQVIAQDMAQNLDEVIWTADPQKDNPDSVIAFMISYAEEYLRHHEIQLRIDAPFEMDAVEMASGSRHQLFQTFKEALTNIIKHSGATEVWLRFRLEKGHFQVEVQDNGRGVDQSADISRRNGIRNMNKRMENVAGEFHLIAQPGKGVLAKISVPVGVRDASAAIAATTVG